MSYTKYTVLANPQNYGGTRKCSSIKYLVYHYTANKTDRAKSNANYFKNNSVKASAHYFVDETDVYQSVPDLTIAYAVGGSKYPSCKETGGGKMYGKVTNSNSISVEMCSTNGEISEKTITNAISLGKELMKRYNIPASNIFRHFDINGKPCPGWAGWYGANHSKWNSFLKKFNAATTSVSSTVISSQQDRNETYKVRLLDDLNIRKTPNGEIVQNNGAKKGTVYTITRTSGSWGKLKSGAGWICVSAKYVRKV